MATYEGDTNAYNENTLGGRVGAIALGTLVPAKAQYYYPRPPDYGYAYPPPDDRYGYGWTWNDCAPGWTVQGETVHPIKVPLAEDGVLGTAVHPCSERPTMFWAIRSRTTATGLASSDRSGKLIQSESVGGRAHESRCVRFIRRGGAAAYRNGDIDAVPRCACRARHQHLKVLCRSDRKTV
jgi:hypothetical protein